MPTLPSLDHSRDDSLSPVPDPPRATSSLSQYPETSFTTSPASLVGSISRRNRRSLAAWAQKRSSAFANLSISQTSTLRPSGSSGSLSKPSKTAVASPLTPPLLDGDAADSSELPRPDSPALADLNLSHQRRLTLQRIPTPPQETLVPSSSAEPIPKMHQTSSRLLRMTEDERPFTKVCRNELVAKGVYDIEAHLNPFLRISWTFSPRSWSV